MAAVTSCENTLYRVNLAWVTCGLGVEDENGEALFSSLEAFTTKIQGKTVSIILVL